MKNQALLVSIRRIRVVEVDGLGAYAQVEFAVARKPGNAEEEPAFEIATLALFARDAKHSTPLGRWKAR